MERELEAVRRRDVLRMAAGVGTLGLPAVLQPAEAALQEPLAASSRRPISMAMHIHASMSEGIGSMHAHLHQAERVGADVIWWTDHDFRMTAHGYRRLVGFDGQTEVANGPRLTWEPQVEGSPAEHGFAFVNTPTSPGDNGGSLRLNCRARAGDAWSGQRLRAVTANQTLSTSYGDTTLRLDVMPLDLSDDAEVVLTIYSSARPATHGRPAGQYVIEYRIGRRTGRWHEAGGVRGMVGVPAGSASSWHTITLDVAADSRALWPDLVPGDASLWRLGVGIEARRGATARAFVDRLRIERSRRDQQQVRADREDMVAAYANRYPGVRTHTSAEISLVNHMNVFGGDGVLPTYNRTGINRSTQAQMAMVEFLKRHGGTVGLNHPLGGQGPTALAAKLVRHRGLGAHSIEVGYGQKVNPMTRVFDIAARNAVFLTATGVTDDHGGMNWLGATPRWLTSVWATGTNAAELSQAIRAGRAWFYDPLHWKGTFELRADGVAPMGGVLFTGHREVAVSVRASALPRDSVLRVVVGHCDRPGLSDLRPRVRVERWRASSLRQGRRTIRVRRGEHGAYVRVQLHGPSGAVIGWSNPIWVLPARLRDNVRVPAERRYRA